jgi:hypothetical protein
MTEIYLRKYYGTLSPADTAAEEVIAKMRQGQAIRLRYSFPRNYGNHNRFWAFLRTTFDMQDHFTDVESYRKWLIMKSGHYRVINCPDGSVIFDTDSIRFDKMDEIKFGRLFEACITAFISAWGDKITRDELENAISFSS